MKNYLNLIMLTIIIVLSGCAGSSKYMAPAEPLNTIPPAKSVVYFMRPSSMGFAVNFQIWDSDSFIGLSQAKSYFAYVCDPGNHLFMGFAENKIAIDADLEAGKEYYIGTNVRLGAWKARMGFTPVTRDSELWDKVDDYKANLNFISLNENEAVVWETEKKAEAQKWVDYFTNGEGKNEVGKLNKEDGR